MLPEVEDDLLDAEDELEIEEEPSKTYQMRTTDDSIKGYVDGIEAVKQSVYAMLNTERYDHVIYSWDYGVELKDLFGEPDTFVIPELERRITEALEQDERILSVDEFEFDTSRKRKILVTFSVSTVFGDFDAEKEVEY
jgi:hypothetical protein